MIAFATKSGTNYIFSRQLYLNTLIAYSSKQLNASSQFYNMNIRGIISKNIDTIFASFSDISTGRSILGTIDFQNSTMYLKNTLPPMLESQMTRTIFISESYYFQGVYDTSFYTLRVAPTSLGGFVKPQMLIFSSDVASASYSFSVPDILVVMNLTNYTALAPAANPFTNFVQTLSIYTASMKQYTSSGVASYTCTFTNSNLNDPPLI